MRLLAEACSTSALVQQIDLDALFPGSRIENFFLEGGVHGKHHANALCQSLPLRGLGVQFSDALVLVEESAHIFMILSEELDRIECAGTLAFADGMGFSVGSCDVTGSTGGWV